MPPHFRSLWQASLLLCALVLAACTPATSPSTSTPDATAIAQVVETRVAETAIAITAESDRVATGIAATLTAQPTETPTETPSPTLTPTATRTPHPTATPTNTPEPTETRPPQPTAPPATATTAASTSDSVYGWTGGPEGYLTDIECFRGSSPCTPIMPVGDVNFTFYLISGPLTPLTLFEKYGLSVEKDGANVANMFMFVDAGLLPPDVIVEFGASRNFTSPGRYVIRSSGCLTTVPAPCQWNTMEGTTVTFTIQ